MIVASGKRLGKILVESGIISPEQLEEAVARASGSSLTSVLSELGFADEVQVAQAIANQMGLVYVDLGTYDIDPNAATNFSSELARRYTVLPIKIQDGELVVAMADPANIFAIDDLRIVTGYEIRPVVAAEGDLLAAIDRFAASRQSVDDMVGDFEETETAPEKVEEDLEGDTAPAAKLLNQIITEAIRQGAGNVYIEPYESDMRVRYRIDGVCTEVFRNPKKMYRQLISRLKIQCGMDIAERRLPQDGRFGVVLDGEAVDFRVAVMPIIHGEMAVLRLLRKESIRMSLEDLGFLPHNMERLNEVLKLPYGAILVTGPTGCGKTTTLYAAINQANDPKMNLITVEDPVEYRLAGLSQVQVHEKAGLTFAAALRSILRQDPDAVMIGEIRDKETGVIAIEAALTGHLVLSTLHTTDAPSTITRLTEMGIEPFLTASAITCVLAQRLARRLCTSCKEQYVPDVAVLERVGFPFDPKNPPKIFRPKGCKKCNGIGYKGRIGIHELLLMSEGIERLTVQHASADEIKRQAIAEGMRTLREDGFEKVLMGITSIEEVLRVVV